MPKITKRSIDSVEPGSKDQYFWDNDLTGFGLRIKPSGVKSFMVQYRNESGRSRRVTIGKYGPLSPEQAKRMARQILGEVAKGEDVAQAKAENRKGLTLKELSERYIEEHAKPKKKDWSVQTDQRLLDKIIIPALGRHKISAIERADIAKLHHEQRETPIQANRVLALLSKIFNLAEQWGLRPDGSNPCRHIQRYKERKRERYLNGEELSRLGAALVEAEKTEMPTAVLAIRLLTFTGCRLNEILRLQWQHVDVERGLLNLPDSKTGAKLVPLSGPAIDLLLSAPRVDGNTFVCFGEKTGHHLVGLQKIWERIRIKAGLEDVRLHDLRHSFASVAAASNMGLPIIGKLLGHTQAATTARYAHLGIDPLKAASDEVGRRIQEAMNQKLRIAKVIPFRK